MSNIHMRLRRLLAHRSKSGTSYTGVELSWQEARGLDAEFSNQAKRIAELEQQLTALNTHDKLEQDRHDR